MACIYSELRYILQLYPPKSFNPLQFHQQSHWIFEQSFQAKLNSKKEFENHLLLKITRWLDVCAKCCSYKALWYCDLGQFYHKEKISLCMGT